MTRFQTICLLFLCSILTCILVTSNIYLIFSTFISRPTSLLAPIMTYKQNFYIRSVFRGVAFWIHSGVIKIAGLTYVETAQRLCLHHDTYSEGKHGMRACNIGNTSSDVDECFNMGTVTALFAGLVPKSESQVEEEEENYERVQDPRSPPPVPRITSLRRHVRRTLLLGNVRCSWQPLGCWRYDSRSVRLSDPVG
jgi:hypothetical protein